MSYENVDLDLLGVLDTFEEETEGDAKIDMWFMVSGRLISGTVVARNYGLDQLLSQLGADEADENQPRENTGDSDDTNKTPGIYLIDVKIVSDSQHLIEPPLMRLKLASVDAWGVGTLVS